MFSILTTYILSTPCRFQLQYSSFSNLLFWLVIISTNANKQLTVISPDSIPSLLAMIASFPSSLIEKHSNVLFEKVFAKPPIVTVGEILKAIAKRAKEKSCKLLRVEQINLAFKQMRLEKIRTTGGNGSNASAVDPVIAVESEYEKENNFLHNTRENDSDNSRESINHESIKEKDFAEVKALKIMMELVYLFYTGKFKSGRDKLHDRSHGKKKIDNNNGSHMSSTDGANEVENDDGQNDDCEPNKDTDETNTDTEEIDVLKVSENILKEVTIPRDKALEESREMTHSELDKINQPIKMYISQLANLKQTISKQLNMIEESGAYLDLGVTKDMSDAEIKRAYHNLSRKIHPDRPGGDTAKFQALQASYNEITQARNKLKHSSCGKSSSTLEGVDKALALESEISSLVEKCKAAAEQVAALTQVTLQALKIVEKTISKHDFPKCAPILYTLLMGESEDGLGGPIGCLMNTVEPTETVAQCIQEISTKSTEISGCSTHFALATALCSGFNKVVEETMSSGLEVLRAVTSMLGIENHASTCLEKMKSSRQLVIEDKEVHDIIVEMMLTVVRSCSVSLKSTADKVLGAVVFASDLQALISNIIHEARADAEAKVQRDTDYAERKAEAEAMGDLEGFLEASKIRPGMKGAESKREDQDSEEDKKTEGNGAEEINDVEQLKAKVQGLQVQIRMQNVSILQSLTGEVRSMQQKMHTEVCRIRRLPAFSVLNNEQVQSKPPHEIQILTLLADLIDHSLVIMRNECNNGSIADVHSWKEKLSAAFDWMKHLDTKLALWPDLRTRTLYLAALIDIDEVKFIISSELVDRLTECLHCPTMRVSQATDISTTTKTNSNRTSIDISRYSPVAIKHEWLSEIKKLCSAVVDGVNVSVETLRSEVQPDLEQDDEVGEEINENDLSVYEFDDIDCDDNDNNHDDKENATTENVDERVAGDESLNEDAITDEDNIACTDNDHSDNDTEIESLPPSPEGRSLDEAVERVSQVLLFGDGPPAADNHTYDKGYKKWENFDVDAALAELESDSDSSNEQL